MRIAVFHDYIGAIGGGEKLVLALARGLGADLITTDINNGSVAKLGFDDVKIISIGRTPKIAPFKQIYASILFASCRFPKYDFYIFSGNWAHYAARRHKPNLWYCHTPVRAFYDLREYALANQKSPIHRAIARAWISIHSVFDQWTLKDINCIATNSANTGKRIKKYYSRDAKVIYPPIPINKFRSSDFGNYWLSVNRLYPEKRIPLQIEAFRKMPRETLKIAGWYSEGDHAKSKLGYLDHLPKNVELLGSVSEDELIKLYASCKGFICTAMDEDFGMTPVEAMASGKPVVAVNEGGYVESVVDGVTGRLVEPSVASIICAVEEISKNGCSAYREACLKRARSFDESIFLDKMKMEIRKINKCKDEIVC
jgi:glycosyltransferase involved in cell wall biosynthesis